jgi:hypothetical protein
MDDFHIGHILSREVLEEMDKLWPERLTDPTMPIRDMIIAAAQRKVINVLWAKWREVNDPPKDDD